MFSSIVIQWYQLSIKAFKGSCKPRHRSNAKYSRHTRNEGSEDRKNSSNNKGLHSKVHSLEAFVHPSISLGNTNYDYNKLKQCFSHLSVLPNRSFNLMEVGVVLGKDAFDLQKALDYKIGTRSQPVLTELG